MAIYPISDTNFIASYTVFTYRDFPPETMCTGIRSMYMGILIEIIESTNTHLIQNTYLNAGGSNLHL